MTHYFKDTIFLTLPLNAVKPHTCVLDNLEDDATIFKMICKSIIKIYGFVSGKNHCLKGLENGEDGYVESQDLYQFNEKILKVRGKNCKRKTS